MPFAKAAAAMIAKLGEEFTYTTEAGVATTVRGVYEDAYQEVDPQTQVAVISQTPMLFCRLQDLPAVRGRGDRITAREVTYRVREFQPDGYGNTDIYLHKV